MTSSSFNAAQPHKAAMHTHAASLHALPETASSIKQVIANKLQPLPAAAASGWFAVINTGSPMSSSPMWHHQHKMYTSCCILHAARISLTLCLSLRMPSQMQLLTDRLLQQQQRTQQQLTNLLPPSCCTSKKNCPLYASGSSSCKTMQCKNSAMRTDA
jgi:hypothetical protein